MDVLPSPDLRQCRLIISGYIACLSQLGHGRQAIDPFPEKSPEGLLLEPFRPGNKCVNKILRGPLTPGGGKDEPGHYPISMQVKPFSRVCQESFQQPIVIRRPGWGLDEDQGFIWDTALKPAIRNTGCPAGGKKQDINLLPAFNLLDEVAPIDPIGWIGGKGLSFCKGNAGL